MRSPNSPGFLGYVATTVLASVLLSVGVWIADSFSDIGPFGALYLFLFVSVLTLGVPLLLLVLPLLVVHLACRRVADQRMHVAWTGIAYLVPALAVSPWLGGTERTLALAVAPAMAIGRAAVIGRVPEHQARRAAR